MQTQNYEPQAISEIVYGNDESKLRIEEIINGDVPFPFNGKTGILLYGVYGTGKTTMANLLPEAIEQGQEGTGLVMQPDYFGCEQAHNSIAITSLVAKQLNTMSLNASGKHYFIFDEVDNLSKAAQGGLKTTLNSKRAVFILTTNNLSQLDKGVRDRCILIEMNAATDAEFLPLARRIAADKDIILSDVELLTAVAGCNGSFRTAIFNTVRHVSRTKRIRSKPSLIVPCI